MAIHAPKARKNSFTRISRWKFTVLLLAVFMACLCTVYALSGYTERKVAADMAATARDRLALYSGTLHSALSKYAYLPHILATHPEIQRLVKAHNGSEDANIFLEDVNAASGSMELFILDPQGVCVAASNWNKTESFVGQDYSYRPYYQDALRLGKGRYFGVGATTGKPGFFFTELIIEDGVALGVAVVKVDLAILQREWRDGGETVFITDEHGIIFLSSRDDWRYRATVRLDAAASAAMLYQRQYGPSLPPLIPLRLFNEGDVNRMEIGEREWLCTTRPLDEHNWTIWFLSPLTALEDRAQAAWYMGAAFSGMTVLLLVLARVFLAWRRARRQAENVEKTRVVNRRLEEEIRIRKQTERELLAAQDDLLHASRMAALGQVAASLVHELSQPVTSMSMFASSCRRLADEGRHEKVAETLGHMQSLVQRIKSLIEQLRHFSRKTPGKLVPVSVCGALENALFVLRFKQETAQCVPEVLCRAGVMVMADALQLEQVCINLIQNALDAVSFVPEEERRMRVVVAEEEEHVAICIEDSGPGIPEDVRENIFTPFFTTKNSGEGIGLGLAIVDNIVRSLKGEITAEAASPRGARFIVRLPGA